MEQLTTFNSSKSITKNAVNRNIKVFDVTSSVLGIGLYIKESKESTLKKLTCNANCGQVTRVYYWLLVGGIPNTFCLWYRIHEEDLRLLVARMLQILIHNKLMGPL